VVRSIALIRLMRPVYSSTAQRHQPTPSSKSPIHDQRPIDRRRL
jgi:hypothetical protein